MKQAIAITAVVFTLGCEAPVCEQECDCSQPATEVTPPTEVAKESASALPPSEVKRTVRSHVTQIKSCYEQELTNQPELAGKVVVGFTISGEGSVSGVEIKSSSLGSASVESCVMNEVKTWEFDKPEGGGTVVVTYPFIFRSQA
jgi:TonB family protein